MLRIGNFEKKYLVCFAKTLFEKEKKIKQTLNTINDPLTQEKIVLKIYYEDYSNNKDLIDSLIKEGYSFAIILDDKFDITETNIRRLSIFKYVLIPKTYKKLSKIQIKEDRINSTIIYGE